MYIENLEAKLGQSYPSMVQLVRHSLDNTPDLRPSSGEVLSKVSGAKNEVDRVYGGGVLKQLDIGKVLVAKKIKRMEQRIEELEVSQNLFCCNSKVSIFYIKFTPHKLYNKRMWWKN